jgi:hypothetical protein
MQAIRSRVALDLELMLIHKLAMVNFFIRPKLM